MRTYGLALSVVVAASVPVAAAGRQPSTWPLPELTIRAVAEAPVLDGDLGDECWRNAVSVTEFHDFVSRKPVTQKAWLTYDHLWLYAAFEVTHPRPERIKPTCFEHDGHVGGDDCVEIFIDPGVDSRLYCHYLLNAANTRAEQRVTKDRILRERDWDAPWRSAVRRTPKGWNAEIALPLTILAAYGDLAAVRLNLCITLVDPIVDPHGVIVGHRKQHASWAPVIKQFHEPTHFGILRELRPEPIRVPFLPAFSEAKVGAYRQREGAYSYPVALKLRNHTTEPGTVVLAIRDEPTNGEATELTQPVELKPEERRSLEVAVGVNSPSSRRAVVQLRDALTGEILQSEHVADTAHLTLMTAYLDRNYYTTEEQAVAVCCLSMPRGALVGMSMLAQDAKGNVLGRHRAPGSETSVVVPLATFGVGTHPITVSLCRHDNGVVFAQKLAVVKKPPKPGCEWKIDRVNRAVLKDGKPFFPFGIIVAHPTEAAYQEAADAGFNCFLHWSYVTSARYDKRFFTVEDVIRMAETHQMYILDVLDNHTPVKGGSFIHWKLKYAAPGRLPGAYQSYDEVYARKTEVVREAIAKLRDHPLHMGYFNIDEPADTAWVRRAARGYYEAVNEIDGYHPTFFNCGNLHDYCDIVGADPYWVPAGANLRRGTPNAVVHYYYGYPYRNYDKLGKSLHRPVWMVPMAEWWSGVHKRPLLPQEQMCQTYLLLIHGVKGLFYFRHPFMHQATLDVLSRLARQMKTLAPIVCTPEVPVTVTYTPGKFDPEHGQFPDVQVALKANPAGGYVLLAANSKYYPVDTQFRVSLLGHSGTVMRLFAKDSYAVRDGVFADRIEGYGVRAYVLDAHDSSASPIELTVATKSHPQLAKAEPVEIPRTGRPGKRNIVPNPSFESFSLPDWPDYYRFLPPSSFLKEHISPFLGIPNAPYGLDRSAPFHGKLCARLAAREEAQYNRYPRTMPKVFCYLAPQVDRPENYVFSAYIRAERNGARAQFLGTAKSANGDRLLGNREFTLTTEWQRYSEATVVPPGLDEYTWIGVCVRGEGAVWMDALQFEKGREPTTFEP